MSSASAESVASFAGSQVESKLRRAWRKEQRFFHSRGLCFFLLWVIALILLDFVVDWLFLIPGYGRMVLLAVNVAALASVVWREWVRYLRRYDPVRTALQVERRHAELSSRLVSFVQLSGDPGAESIASPTLIRALQRETLEATRPLDFREIVSFRELRRIFLLSAAVIALFALISVIWSEDLRVLALRMLNPGAEFRYPTRTQILSVTGDVTAQQGDSVTVKAVAGGLVPKHATLYVRPPDGTWETLILTGNEEAEFYHRFQEVYQGFAYRIRVGDAASDVHHVRIVPPPRIVDTRVRLRFPSYTKRKEEVVDILNLELPESTEIEWELRCDQPLAAARMILEAGDEPPDTKPMTLDPMGQVARLTLAPGKSFSYKFEWTERDHGYLYKEDVRYFVQLIPDLPPQVEILAPTEDEKATVRRKLTITWTARDDYSISKAWIVYTLNEGPEQKHPLGSFRERLVEKKGPPWTIRDSVPKLKKDDIVAYKIEVADNHEGKEGPFLARSQVRHITVVSDEEYRQYIAERRRKLLAEIKGMHQQEEEAETQVEILKDIAPEFK